MLYFYNMSITDYDLVFKALASPVRRALLDELKDAPATTGDLCSRFEALDRCTVMQHLKVLEDADARQAVSVLKELKDTLESGS
jgi:DNA-binding transcriptional ArsR family regulator